MSDLVSVQWAALSPRPGSAHCSQLYEAVVIAPKRRFNREDAAE